MKQGTLIFLLLTVLISGQLANANGGGYNFGIEETGQALAFDMEGVSEVRMEEEFLDIHLQPDDARVKVRYRLVNEGKKTKVRFGFPVEAQRPFSSFDPVSESHDPSVVPAGLDNYQVFLNGKELKAIWKAEEESETSSPDELRGLAGWLVSEATFPARSEVDLQISYQVKHEGSSYSVSDDSTESPKTFKYRFSTGAVWKGPIKKGTVQVTFEEGLIQELMEIKKPVNRFQKHDSGWTWVFENLEPTLADDLEIEVTPQIESRYAYRAEHGGIEAYLRRGEVWSAVSSNYEVEASSVLPPEGVYSYDAKNLKEWGSEKGAVVWSEGSEGSGVGEWVLLKPKKATRLIGLQIAGGFQEPGREELFKANARPRVIEMILNGEHRQTFKFADTPSLENCWIVGYHQPVKTCKLVIREVYPGERFSDLCLTKVSILSFLEKEPKHQGAR